MARLWSKSSQCQGRGFVFRVELEYHLQTAALLFEVVCLGFQLGAGADYEWGRVIEVMDDKEGKDGAPPVKDDATTSAF